MSVKSQVKSDVDADIKEKFASLATKTGFDSIAAAIRVWMTTCVNQNSININTASRGNGIITNPEVIAAIEQLESGKGKRRELPDA